VLREHLEAAGVPCRLLARTPGRANLVARIPGRDPAAPRLLLLSHTDTVAAEPAEWSVDPWSGEVRDGALDMKGQAAAGAAVMATLARGGHHPAGDLVYVAAADEEVGAGHGLAWLCEAHPEAVRADYAINEGGGGRVVRDGRPAYLCATAEKATCAVRITVRGRAGHASTPGLADNALVRAAEALARLAAARLPRGPGGELEGMLEAEPRPTLVPTMIAASDRANVVPGACAITCDCRLLPGQRPEDVEPALRAALEGIPADIDWLEYAGGSGSPIGTPLWEAARAFVAAEEAGAELVPMLMPGFTDSHHLRRAFGTVAYGFFPQRATPAETWALIHSADERVALDDLLLGARFLLHAARAMAG
jgi:acetylornithine deacetylase/succinyl-diaminopimelate desuccinylase-like protein